MSLLRQSRCLPMEATEITHFFPVSIQASTSTFPKTATFSLFPPIMRILCSKLIRTTFTRTGGHSISQASRRPQTVTSSSSLARESGAKKTRFPQLTPSRSNREAERTSFRRYGNYYPASSIHEAGSLFFTRRSVIKLKKERILCLKSRFWGHESLKRSRHFSDLFLRFFRTKSTIVAPAYQRATTLSPIGTSDPAIL